MPVWAAARCTSAAFPFFKPFRWQGQMLLDGGFQLNCPAAAAFSEAKSIWPKKRCDTLISLGTGRPSIQKLPPAHNYVRLIKDITEAVTNTEETWDRFAETAQKHGIIRLRPDYKGIGFELDDFRRLDEIKNQTKAWLESAETNLINIRDQLIAALFFFVPDGPIKNGMQMGKILCRLPVDLEARQNLFDEMRQEQDMNLFTVEFIGRSRYDREINVARSLSAISSGEELEIRVELRDLAEAGEIVIQINMRSLGIDASGRPWLQRWYPISGSPYVLGRQEK